MLSSLGKDLDCLAIHPDSPSPDLSTLCLDHLFDRPGLVFGLGEPRQVVGDEMPVLASWTLYDYDAFGVGTFREFVCATVTTLVHSAGKSDG